MRYHCPIFSVFNFDKCKQNCFKRKIWKYDDGNYELLNNLVSEFDWSSIKSDNINLYAECFTEKILEFCHLAIPHKMIIVRPSDPPCFNNCVRRAIRKRKRAHKRAKRIDTEEAWRKFRVLRNTCVKVIKNAKHEYKFNLVKRIAYDDISSKDWWKIFKTFIGKDKHESIPPLNYNGQIINNANEKADLFNTYFHSQAQLDDQNIDVQIGRAHV